VVHFEAAIAASTQVAVVRPSLADQEPAGAACCGQAECSNPAWLFPIICHGVSRQCQSGTLEMLSRNVGAAVVQRETAQVNFRIDPDLKREIYGD
jgi:hypothetical protein